MKVHQLILLACVCILPSQAVLANSSSHERQAQDTPNSVVKMMPAKKTISRDNLPKKDLNQKRPERKVTPLNRALSTKNMRVVKPHTISKTAPSPVLHAVGGGGELEKVSSCTSWLTCLGFKTACTSAGGSWESWGAGVETCTTQ